jgi:integrase
MITDKQVQKAIREAPASGRASIELKDSGERGAGRLAVIVRPLAGRVAAEWYAVYYRAGKRVMAKLGSYPTMPLIEARAKFLVEYAPVIASGAEPASAATRRRTSGGTVAELFAAYVAHLESGGKRVAPDVDRLLLSPKSGAARSIGADRPAASIQPEDIVAHLAAIHSRGSIVHATNVRAYLSSAFNFGIKAEHDYTRKNAGASWGIKSNPVAAIPVDRTAYRARDRFLSPLEVQTFWRWLLDYQSASTLAAVPLLMLATGQRVEEVLRINNVGYDRQKRMLFWQDTKNGLPHSIPMPHQAVEILDELVLNSKGLFFPHRFDATIPAPYTSVRCVIQRFRGEQPIPDFSPRDLRRTWKTLAGDAGIPKDMRDRLQNHSRKADVSSRHYDRYDYLPERRAAMTRWAAYLDLVIAGKVAELGAQADNVVPIGKVAAA